MLKKWKNLFNSVWIYTILVWFYTYMVWNNTIYVWNHTVSNFALLTKTQYNIIKEKLSNFLLFIYLKFWNQNSIENHIVSRSLRFFLGFSWLLDISMKKPRKIPSSPAANWVMKRRLWFNVGNKEKVGLFPKSRQNQLERNGFRIVNLPRESW